MTQAMKKTSSEESSAPPSLPERNYTTGQANPVHDVLPAPRETQSKTSKKNFFGVFRKKQESSLYDTPDEPLRSPPARKEEHVYHVYDSSKLSSDPDEQLEESVDSGGNSMSELAAAAILKEMAASGDTEYDSLDLTKNPIAQKGKRDSSKLKEESNVYCELPKNHGEESVYDEVHR